MRPRLLEVLERVFPTSASSWGLTLLTRGFREPSWPDPRQVYDTNSRTPSIYITCANPELLLEDLDGILSLCSLRAEVHTGTASLSTEDGCCGYETKVSMGRSIGLVGNSSSGTMGGWVFDVQIGQIYGVTAGHVCLAHRRGQVKGLPYSESGMQLVQPSDSDHAAALLQLEEEVAISHRRSEQMGFMHQRLEANRLKYVQRLNEYKVGSGDRAFGTVLYGYVGTTTSQWKDYAMISAQPSMWYD